MSDLSEAFVSWLRAAKKYDKAVESCYEDADYFCRHEQLAVERAEKSFVSELYKALKEHEGKT
jgi:hypothetical protein